MPVTTQNASYKQQIYIGDTFPIVIEHRLQDNSGSPIASNRGIPSDVDTASIMVWSVTVGEYLELGGPSVVEVPCTIAPASGQTGGIISYTLAGSFTNLAGEYAAYVSFTYNGGQRSTIRQRFKVKTKQ